MISDSFTLQDTTHVVLRPDTIEAKATVHNPTVKVIGTAVETDEALPITPKTGPAPKTTAVDVATHSCELRITPRGDKLQYDYVEVIRDSEVIASGMGDDLVEALLGVIEYMLPSDHPEYPKDSEFPDDAGLSD